MGIGFVLLLWAVAGVILAGIGSLVLAGVTAYLTRGVVDGRGRTILLAAVFPAVCLAWAGIMFIFQATVNEGLLHRDAGMGDTWHCPLPNGYQILMIDETDHGWVYNPKTQEGGSVTEQDDAVGGVRTLQVAGRYILGGSDSKWFGKLNPSTDEVDSYFLMDAAAGKHNTFSSYDELATAARSVEIEPRLEPILDVYSKYRFSWFEVFAGLLFVLPMLTAATFLARRIFILRRNRKLTPQTA